MSKAVTTTVEKTVPAVAQKPAKPAAKAVTKTETKAPAKSAAKKKDANGVSAIVNALTTAPAAKPAPMTAEEKKALRDKRYPQAAAQEAAKEKAKADAKAGIVKAKAEKPAKNVIAFVPRHMAKGQPIHVLTETARPSSGSRLFAHTHAVFTVLGMLDAKLPAVPQAQVLQMMGARAVAYHLKQMNFESAPNHGIRLSVAGRNHFMARLAEGKIDTNAANAFVTMMLDGKIDRAATGVAQENVYQVKYG